MIVRNTVAVIALMLGSLFDLIYSVGELHPCGLPHPFGLGAPVAAFADQPIAPKPNLVKVAAVQVSGYDKGELPRDAYRPVESLLPYIDRAGREEAELVVFPEYVLGHIKIPGPETNAIAAAAKANSLYVIVGCWEDLADGAFSNQALLFDREGGIVGRYAKTHRAVDHFEGDQPWQRPPAGKSRRWMLENDPEWEMRAGNDLPVFDLDFGRIGIMTCYDGWFPEPPRVLSLRGAELVVWINGRRGTVEDFIVRSVMFQSHVAMVTANQAYGGGTMIGDGRSQILAQTPPRQEAYVSATINLGRVRQMRAKSRNFAQRRPDLYGDLIGELVPRQTANKQSASKEAQ
jgi:predicted amidohydrolase